MDMWFSQGLETLWEPKQFICYIGTCISYRSTSGNCATPLKICVNTLCGSLDQLREDPKHVLWAIRHDRSCDR